MPLCHVPGSVTTYEMICYDARGRERIDDPDGLMSDRILQALSEIENPVTDVFLLSHGWRSDIPGAKAQYDSWVDWMLKAEADLARMKQQRPGFRPLIVGFHWPSLPWGTESFGNGSFSVPLTAAGTPADPVETMVNDYADRIADTPKARAALRTIITAAMNDIEPPSLAPELRQAYLELDREAGSGAGGASAAPGDDRDGFDPASVYRAIQDDPPSFGGLASGGGVLDVLRALSFWRMKDRARKIGETAGCTLLAQMMQSADRSTRFHLLGHSFGCIVVASMLAGPGGKGRVAKPVDSAVLMQGALSLWSFCTDLPYSPGRQGYFSNVMSDRRVRGPLLTTQSSFDTAVGKWYPLGAGVSRDVSFAPGELPKFGAVGEYGIRGPGADATDLSIQSVTAEYKFAPGKVYNVDCSAVVKNGDDSCGAHSDICHPELAHAVWQAALAGG